MNLLSPLQKSILEYFIEYKQLTIPQLTILEQGEVSSQSIRRNLTKLHARRKPLVNRVEFQKVSHFGKLSYVYNITLLGVKALEKAIKHKVDEQAFTPVNPRLSDDYFHRTTTISFQIHMKLYEQKEGYSVLKCNHYFVIKRGGNGFYPINKIRSQGGKSIIPDLVVMLIKEKKRRLILFELHNGKDKRRIKDQIKQHALCLVGLYAHMQYNVKLNRFYYILLVFEEIAVMKSVIKDIVDDLWYSEIARFFLCKPLSGLHDTFLNGWVNLLGEDSSIEF